MRKKLLKSRSTQRAGDVERIKAKLTAFGGASHNPVKDEIEELRAQRDAGAVSEADYAAKVAGLLGTSESAIA